MRPIFLLFVTMLLALAGCSMSADTAVAEQEVPRFHQQLDAAQFVDIYQACADEMKKATSEKNFIAFLEAVHRKLGLTKTSERQGWHVNYTTTGAFVTLVYKTKFAEGEASEQFVYRLDGKVAKLVGYNVNSNAFILK